MRKPEGKYKPEGKSKPEGAGKAQGCRTVAERLKGFAKLIRLQTILATCLAPVLAGYGAWAYDGLLPSAHRLLVLGNLFIVAAFIHIFGEILNDYMDLNLDSKNPELSKKPLVSGAVSKREAQIAMAVSFVLIFIAAIPLFSVLAFVMLAVSVLQAILYDVLSKRSVHSPIFMATWAFTLGLFGGICTGGYSSILDIPGLVWIICLLGGFQMWMNTAILGHLKDVENDGKEGVLTFPIYMGVRVRTMPDGAPPSLVIPSYLKVMVLALQVLNLAIAFVPVLFWSDFYEGFRYLFVTLTALVLLAGLILWAQGKIMWYPVFNRKKLMRLMAVREVSAYFLVIALLVPICGPVLAVVLVLLPFLWFLGLNFLFTRNPMEPPI